MRRAVDYLQNSDAELVTRTVVAMSSECLIARGGKVIGCSCERDETYTTRST